MERYRAEDGNIIFSETGDDLIDHWEQLIADGKADQIDLLEGYSDTDKTFLGKKLKKKDRAINSTFGATQEHVDKHMQKLIKAQEPTPVPFRKFGD